MGDRSADLPRYLSARFQSDFAYPTVKDRMPVILTKVVDTVFRMKAQVTVEFGTEALEDLKQICGALSQLKNEMQTNKKLTDLPDDGTGDEGLWNVCLQCDDELQQAEGAESAWFVSPWLLIECYFYRRIHSAIRLSSQLKSLDPFCAQKESAFTQSLPAMTALASYILDINTDSLTNKDASDHFYALFHVALWGNKCDLSISGGASNSQTNVDVLGQVNLLEPYVLCDETSQVWNLISLKRHCCVDIVLDNAGFELFTDLCLAEFLISTGMASHVRFYGKRIPWFVSDVTASDWQWSLDQLTTSSSTELRTLGQRWQQYLADGVWRFSTHLFWTLPHDFAAMKSVAPDLYDNLSTADIVLFKGDLNYRKLVDDRVWPTTTPFTVALRGFSPASLCCLRTLKCDLVVGLAEGQAESAQAQHGDWMITGSYAVIQFSNVAS